MSEKKKNGPGPVPQRWMFCPRKASELIHNVFMAFKTPLDERFDEQVPPACQFHPTMLLESCKSKKIDIGLWIDLTNTDRFYNKKVIEKWGCKYIKVPCRGHGETPSPDQTTFFINLVSNFVAQNPLKAIGIHCTHGFNRTGFLIVSYIVETTNCSLDFALSKFAKARPPGIYKPDYLKELYRRLDEESDTPAPPQLPSWCFDEEGSDNESEESKESTSSSTSNRRPKKPFMEGVPGVEEFTEHPKARELQKKVRIMCGWKNKTFPGSQPVSMDNSNIVKLHTKAYRVSWKADGTRYMMLIDGFNEVYFFDRDHTIYQVQGLTFPSSQCKEVHIKDTLLDGEMVIDKVNGKNIPRYLVYDIVYFEGNNIGQTAFYPTRTHHIINEIIRPRSKAIEQGYLDKTAEPFSIRNKEFWDVTYAAALLGPKFAASLSHEPDGLIFQPCKDPYLPGTCPDVLKWKPANMNSIDFRLKITTEGGMGKLPSKIAELHVGQYEKPIWRMKYKKWLNEYDGKIIECKLENNEWIFMRERTDKSFPNSYTTAKSVWDSIVHPITTEKLLDYIEKERYKEDRVIMPPPTKKIRRSANHT